MRRYYLEGNNIISKYVHIFDKLLNTSDIL